MNEHNRCCDDRLNPGSNLTSFRFDGLDGRDTLVGGAGDDTLIGGPSNDIAVFSGPRSAYRFTLNLDHSLEVADLRPGHPDGVDTLSSIERLQFSDATYLVDSLFSTAFHP